MREQYKTALVRVLHGVVVKCCEVRDTSKQYERVGGCSGG